jgi:lysophospholipase L1-like esterase
MSSSSIELSTTTTTKKYGEADDDRIGGGGRGGSGDGGSGDYDDDDEETMPMISSPATTKTTSERGVKNTSFTTTSFRTSNNSSHLRSDSRRTLMDYIATIRYLVLSSSTTCRAIIILTVVLVVALYINNNNSNSTTSTDDSDFPQFCDVTTGLCHEQPWIGSPRTKYSAWTQEQLDLWWTVYHTQQQHAYEYLLKRYYKQQQYMLNTTTTMSSSSSVISTGTRPLILLGDSITESWNGTGLGIVKNRCKGTPEVLQDKLITQGGFDPLLLAVSGDQTQHLLYRLETLLTKEYVDEHHLHLKSNDDETSNQLPVPPTPSELRASMLEQDPTAIYVIMIGTNNIGSGELPEPTSRGILKVAEYVLEYSHPSSRVLLLELLPRGDGSKVLRGICSSSRCRQEYENISSSSTNVPFQSFMPAINKVNDLVHQGITTLQNKYRYRKPGEPSTTNDDYRSRHRQRRTSADDGKRESSASIQRIKFVDCGSARFLSSTSSSSAAAEEEEVKKDLMPDLLHPNSEGMKVIADCILDFVNNP